ncbi:MAG: hypothetical protein IKK75_02350 [Clostridia bacterium]|nr:hypothetical protein [Clostridia bacterium]
MKKAMPYLAFLLTWIATVFLSFAEWLRSIQGEAFLVLWPAFAVITLLATYKILKAIRPGTIESCVQEIRNAAISHIDIPHLTANSDPIALLQVKGYYLLRLYLLGVFTYKRGMLMVDDNRLKSLMDQGGRHSKIAYAILEGVRKTGDRSMLQVLTGIPSYDSNDDHVLAKQIDEKRKKNIQQTSCVLAVAFGLIWGVGCAKLALGIDRGKAVGLLLLLFFVGIIASVYIVEKFLSSAKADFDGEVHQAIMDNFRQRPRESNWSVLAQLNETLPGETERHKILNSYFIDSIKMQQEAAQLPEGTFMHDWGAACMTRYDEIRKAQQEAAARRAAAQAAESSSCSSCGGCSSCSSCGGCGGCGD